jgi:predicted AlkP superfamily phosphohydrolase/phosphomutase
VQGFRVPRRGDRATGDRGGALNARLESSAAADVHEPPPRSGNRVLVIGLDAADSRLLSSGIDRGALPHLAGLRERGAWGFVPSMAGFGSGALWPSFATGVSPAKHGRYFYRQIFPGSYATRDFHPEQFRAEAMWSAVSEAGRRVAVFDVPKVGLPDHLNGVMAVDWISHGPVYPSMRTLPAAYGDELVARYGTNPMRKCDMPGGRDVDELREFTHVLFDRIRQRERCTVDLLDAGDYDLIVTVFADPHCAGHQTWHVRDPRHPQFDAEAHAQLGDPVLDVYGAIDESIGTILEHVDDDTTLIVFSGTGMGPNYTGNHLLDEVLRRIEGRQATAVSSVTRRVKRRIKRMLPRDLRRRSQRLKRRIEEQTMTGDRAGRRAFVAPHNDIAGAIRLNIRGREARGLLDPTEVDEYVQHLSAELLSVRNADTGEPAVSQVVRVSEHHHGDALDLLPDLFVIWNRVAPLDRVTSPTIGTVEYVHRGNRTGDHEAESWFVAVGPGVVPGQIDDVQIYDFAPTIASLLGVGVATTDGRVVPQLTSDSRSRPTT